MSRNPILGIRAQPRAGASLIKPTGWDICILRQPSLGKTRLNVCKFRLSSMEQHTKDVLETEGPLLCQRRSTTTATNSYSGIKKPAWLHRHFGTQCRRKATPSRLFG